MSFFDSNLTKPSSALIWSTVRKNQWGIIGLFLSIPVILFLELISSNVFDFSFLNGSSKVQVMLLVAILPLLVMIITYSELNSKTALTGFPKFTFTYPISTLRLALTPILFGIVVTNIFVSAWFLFVSQKDYNLSQYFILFVTCNISVVWLQFMAWRLASAHFISMSTFVALLALMFVFIVSVWDIENNPPVINPLLAQLGLVALLVSGFWLAINSVKRSRTNQSFGKNWRMSEIQFVGFALPESYFSKQQALFRFEWRVFGWLLPLGGLFMASVIIFLFVKKNSDIELIDNITLMLALVIYLPLFTPAEMARTHLGSKTKTILPFTAQLPITNFDLANVKLRLILKSIMVFLSILLLPLNLFSFSLEIGEKVLQPWSWLTTNIGILGASLVWISINLVIPIIIWTITGNTMSWLLKGKSFFNTRVMTFALIEVSFIAFIAYRFYLSEELRELLSDYYPALNISVLLFLGLIFTRAVRKFNHYYESKGRSLKSIYLTVLSLTLVFLFTLWFVEFDSQVKFHASFILLDIAILITLPFLTAPFSIKENRSR